MLRIAERAERSRELGPVLDCRPTLRERFRATNFDAKQKRHGQLAVSQSGGEVERDL